MEIAKFYDDMLTNIILLDILIYIILKLINLLEHLLMK